MSQEDKCTETLEGDKIGCIYSVMIKMATTTNVQEFPARPDLNEAILEPDDLDDLDE